MASCILWTYTPPPPPDLSGGAAQGLKSRLVNRPEFPERDGQSFRNPQLGLIEQWGSGIQRMTAACRDAGLAPSELMEIGTRFRVTLRTPRLGPGSEDEKDRAILDALAESDGDSTRHIAEKIGLTPRATRTRLMRVVERGLVHEVGTGPNDPRREYVLSRSRARRPTGGIRFQGSRESRSTLDTG